MKKIIFYSVFIMLLMSSMTVFAQVATSTGSSETTKQTQQQQKKAELEKKKADKKTELEQKAVEKKAEMEKRKVEFQQRMTDKKRALILAYGEKMIKRLDTAVDRQSKIAERIQAYAEKTENKDRVNKAEILPQLTILRGKITTIKTTIAAAKTDLPGMFNAEDPKESMEKVRTEIKDINDTIKAVHQSLVKLVGDLRVKADKADVLKEKKDTEEHKNATNTSSTSTPTN